MRPSRRPRRRRRRGTSRRRCCERGGTNNGCLSARRAEGNVAGVWSPPEAGGTTGSPSPHGHAPRQGRRELVARHICTRFQRPIRGALFFDGVRWLRSRCSLTERLHSDVPPGHAPRQGRGELAAPHILRPIFCAPCFAPHVCTRFRHPIRGALLMIRQSGGCARVARFTDRLHSDVPPGHYASERKELRYHRYRSSYSIPLRWRKSKYSS
jgi:hypothetical protein